MNDTPAGCWAFCLGRLVVLGRHEKDPFQKYTVEINWSRVLENALAWFLAPNVALWNSHSSFRGRVTVQVSRAWRLVMITWPTSKDRADSICYNHWLMEIIICYNRWRFNLLTTLSWSLRSHLFWRVARTGGDNIDPETENPIIFRSHAHALQLGTFQMSDIIAEFVLRTSG